MILHPFQADLIEAARSHLRRSTRRVLIQLATGGGKTVLAAFMIRGVQARGLRVWFVVHRKELIRQTSRTFSTIGIPHGFVAADFPMAAHETVQLCGVQTLALRLDTLATPDVIIWDEAHHATAGTWATVMARFPQAIHIGLSATPERLDGAGLGQHFDVMVQGPTTADLIGLGFLAPYRYFAPGVPDLTGVRNSAGDFNRGDIGSLMDQPQLIGDVVEHYQRLAAGQSGIVFAVSRDHSRNIAAAFRAAGIAAEHVDGSMSARERDGFDAAFRAGEITIGCNCELFGEGYDVPGIGYVGLARPTTSLSLHLQQCGRGLRTFPGKVEAIICDHAGNALRGLGLPDDRRMWSLDGWPRRGMRQAANDAVSIHQCPECYQITASTTSICPCGHEFAGQPREVKQAAGSLFELQRLGTSEREEIRRRSADDRKREEREATTLGALIQLGKARGYPKAEGWARKKIELREQARRGGFVRRRA